MVGLRSLRELGPPYDVELGPHYDGKTGSFSPKTMRWPSGVTIANSPHSPWLVRERMPDLNAILHDFAAKTGGISNMKVREP